MSGFLYFVEGFNGNPQRLFAPLGLRDVFGDDSGYVGPAGDALGPDGLRGRLFGLARDVTPDRAKFDAAAQTWRRAAPPRGTKGQGDEETAGDAAGVDSAARHGLWIGFWNDDRPTAAQLARDEQIAGHRVRLGDGGDWLVPTARVFPLGTRLPESLVLGPDGELVREAIPRFARISRMAEQVWADLETMGQGGEITLREGWDIAAAALSVNYRVGINEVSALGLLTTANLFHMRGPSVLGAFVDWPAVMKAMGAQKKTAADSETDDSG